MKVFIQRSRDGLFLKTQAVWVSSKAEARPFANCTPAIDFCVEHDMKDVRLCLSFGDPRYDLFLEIFRGESRTLPQFSRRKRESVLRRMDSARLQSKSLKKELPLLPKAPERPGKSPTIPT